MLKRRERWRQLAAIHPPTPSARVTARSLRGSGRILDPYTPSSSPRPNASDPKYIPSATAEALTQSEIAPQNRTLGDLAYLLPTAASTSPGPAVICSTLCSVAVNYTYYRGIVSPLCFVRQLSGSEVTPLATIDICVVTRPLTFVL